MERDYEFSSRQHFSDLDSPETIGRKAGERAVKRLNARKAKTGPVDVVFDPRVARGIAGHLAGAINGASVARKTSFLRDMMGKQVARARHHRHRRSAARARARPRGRSTARGSRACRSTWSRTGVLQALVPVDLGGARTRPRDQRPRRRARLVGVAVVDQSRRSSPASGRPEELIKSLKTGFYVTEVFGQGVNMVTGEYSRGASGFWIENGELAYPVSEVTIASNLKDMFLNMIPASDLDRNFGTAAPTLLIEGMTLAGS